MSPRHSGIVLFLFRQRFLFFFFVRCLPSLNLTGEGLKFQSSKEVYTDIDEPNQTSAPGRKGKKTNSTQLSFLDELQVKNWTEKSRRQIRNNIKSKRFTGMENKQARVWEFIRGDFERVEIRLWNWARSGKGKNNFSLNK